MALTITHDRDKEPKRSIKWLKRERNKWKLKRNDPNRQIMLEYLDAVIDYKQKLYSTVLQGVKGWKWGLSQRTK